MGGGEQDRGGLGHDHGGVGVVDGGHVVVRQRGVALDGLVGSGVRGAGGGLLRGQGGDVLAGAPLDLRADFGGGLVQGVAHAWVVEAVGGRGQAGHAPAHDVEGRVHAHDHAVVAGLRAAQGQLRAKLRKHVGHERGHPHRLVGVAGGEGRGIQVVVLLTVVVAVDAVRGLLERTRGAEVVLLRKGGAGQAPGARQVAVAQQVLGLGQAVLRQGVAEGAAHLRAQGVRDGFHHAGSVRGGVVLRAGDKLRIIGGGVVDRHRLVQVLGHEVGALLDVVVEPHHFPVHAVLVGGDVGRKARDVVRGERGGLRGAGVLLRCVTNTGAGHGLHQGWDGEGRLGRVCRRQAGHHGGGAQ